MQFVKDSVQFFYLEFVQWVFVVDIICYVLLLGDGSYVVMEYWGGGGINLLVVMNFSVCECICMVVSEWFYFYCFVKGGKVVCYFINDDVDLMNVDRFVCYLKSDKLGEIVVGELMFGMQGFKFMVFGGIEKDLVIVMYYLGNGVEVKKCWGYFKVWKFGDLMNFGMIIEVKILQVKMKMDSGIEIWVKLVELEFVKL